MGLTLTDMREALRKQRRADETIFWFCHAWHSGRDSDLYQIMKLVDFYPRLHVQRKIGVDQELLYGFQVLSDLYTKTYGHPPMEYQMGPVRIDDVHEDDILVHTSPRTFACIEAGWPCRVYKWHGGLGVACAEGKNGASFHPLKPDERGYVIGFVR